MKTIMKSIVMTGVLLTSTITTADETKDVGHFRAFDGVPTMEVSEQELNEVSGEGQGRDYFIRAWQTLAVPYVAAFKAGVVVKDIWWTNKYCSSCR